MIAKEIEGSITNEYLNKLRLNTTEECSRARNGDTTLLGTGRDRDASRIYGR